MPDHKPVDCFIQYVKELVETGDLRLEQLREYLNHDDNVARLYMPQGDQIKLSDGAIEQAFEHFCFEDDLFNIASNLFPYDILIREVENPCEHENRSDFIRSLFTNIDIPTQPNIPSESRFFYYRSKINEAIFNIRLSLQRDDYHNVRSNILDVWAWLERMFRLMLVFYRRVFYRYTDPHLDYTFDNALQEHNWGTILRRIDQIEEVFEIGETKDERKRCETKMQNEINNAEVDKEKQNIKKKHENYRKERQIFASHLQSQCWLHWERMSPFDSLDRGIIKESVDSYRNIVAHQPNDEIWQEKGTEFAQEAIEKAEAILNNVNDIRNSYFPEVVFPVNIGGVDAYGRKWIGFLENLSGNWMKTMRWYYIEAENNFDYLTPYMTLDGYGNYNPWMIPLADVMEDLQDL